MASSKDRWTNVEYLTQLKAALTPIFKFNINSTKLIPYLKEQDPDILSDDDEMAITQAKERLSASTELLERVSQTKDWFQSLVQTLAHPDLDKEDVVERMLEIEDSLCEEFTKAQETKKITSTDTLTMTEELTDASSLHLLKLMTSIQKSVELQEQKMDRLTDGLVNLSKGMDMLKQEQEMLRDQCRNIKQGVQQMQTECKKDYLNIKQGVEDLEQYQEHFQNSLTKVMDDCNGTISNVEDIVIDSSKSMDKLAVQLTETKGQIEAGLSQNNGAMKQVQESLVGVKNQVEEHTNETHRKVALLSNLAGRIELHKKKQMDEIKSKVEDTKERLSEFSEKTGEQVEEMAEKLEEMDMKIDASKLDAGYIFNHMCDQLIKDIKRAVSPLCSDTKQAVIDESQQIKHRINALEMNSLDAMDKERELILRSIPGRAVFGEKQSYVFDFNILNFSDRVGSDEKLCSHQWRIPQFSSTISGSVWFKPNKKMRVKLNFGRYPQTVGFPVSRGGKCKFKVFVHDSSVGREWLFKQGSWEHDENDIPLAAPRFGYEVATDIDCDKLKMDGWVREDVLTLKYELYDFTSL